MISHFKKHQRCRDFPLSLPEKDDKSTINSSGRERMAVLDQHIKFLEDNYSVTIAVSWKKQTWGHYWAVNGEGRRGESQSNLAIVNILRHIIMVWLGKNGPEWYWLSACVYVCVWDCFPRTAQHHVCLIITPQSFLASLSLSASSIHLSRSLVEGSALNKAHSHAERMRGSTEWFNSHHNYIQISLTVSSTLLYPFLPKNILALFFSPA